LKTRNTTKTAEFNYQLLLSFENESKIDDDDNAVAYSV